MCFLRHARGFGWLDPNMPSDDSKPLSDTTPPKNRPNHGLRLHDRNGHDTLKRSTGSQYDNPKITRTR